MAVPAVQSQTFTVLHTFTGQGDGNQPAAGLTIDRAGNLYGTTSAAGAGYGTVFKLSHVGSGWVLDAIYTFQGGSDGATPQARVVFGLDGTLYGTTSYGGTGSGTVFNLRPPATSCRSARCPWTETVLYRFSGKSDGGVPGYGDLTFDSAGNIYGTTTQAGMGCIPYGGCGVVFNLTRSAGGWTESVLHPFTGGTDGQTPYSGVTFDGAGNLYGTNSYGGKYGQGTVYELTQTGSSWTETTLHSFGAAGDGGDPFGGLIMDQQGDLYGTTSNNGSAYELQPSGGNWTHTLLYNVPLGADDAPTMDAFGNLYATTSGSFGGGLGNVFKLSSGAGGWSYTDLHDFSITQFSNGFAPVGGAVLDSNGNLYGTTFQGGSMIPPCGEGCGVVWEITP